MEKPSSRFSTFLILLLSLFVAGQGSAWGFVLCIGEDGHSRFEQAIVGHCESAEASCSGTGETCCTADHCGSCRDVETSLDSLHGRSRSDQELALSALPPAILPLHSPAIPLFIRELTANLHPQPPPRPVALASLRTVVLRN